MDEVVSEGEKFTIEQQKIAAYSRAMIDIVYTNMINSITEEQAKAIGYFFMNGSEKEKQDLMDGLVELYGPEIKSEDILMDVDE